MKTKLSIAAGILLATTQLCGAMELIQGMKSTRSLHRLNHQMVHRTYSMFSNSKYPSVDIQNELSNRLHIMNQKHLPVLYELSEPLGDKVYNICINLKDYTDKGTGISPIYYSVRNTDSSIGDYLRKATHEYSTEQLEAIKYQRETIDYFYNNIAPGNVEGKY